MRPVADDRTSALGDRYAGAVTGRARHLGTPDGPPGDFVQRDDRIAPARRDDSKITEDQDALGVLPSSDFTAHLRFHVALPQHLPGNGGVAGHHPRPVGNIKSLTIDSGR